MRDQHKCGTTTQWWDARPPPPPPHTHKTPHAYFVWNLRSPSERLLRTKSSTALNGSPRVHTKMAPPERAWNTRYVASSALIERSLARYLSQKWAKEVGECSHAHWPAFHPCTNQ